MSLTFPPLYMASRSPRRAELLKQIGVPFEPLTFQSASGENQDVCEDVLAGEAPRDYVMRIARLKAQEAVTRMRAQGLPPRLVLAADTTLDMAGQIIGKPEDAEDAVRILRRLSGRTHQVLTAVVIADGETLHEALSVSDVTMTQISDKDIHDYIATGEPFDKAGAYGIQGHAAAFIQEIKGSYSGIMGLPLFETVGLLRGVK